MAGRWRPRSWHHTIMKGGSSSQVSLPPLVEGVCQLVEGVDVPGRLTLSPAELTVQGHMCATGFRA